MGRIARLRDAVAATLTTAARAAGFAPLPWGLDLLLTNSCNLRCTYCPFTSETNDRVFAHTPEVLRFFESIAHFRPMVRLIGGEPFLHPEWQTIVAAAVGRSIPITAVTNGTMLCGRGATVVRSGLSAIGISVDPPEAHDRYRGSGTFDVCESVVREIAAEKAKLDSASPLIEIYTTVHSGTYAHLTRWAGQLAAWPIDTLRLQHEIWLPDRSRELSEKLIRDALGEASFLREEIDAYCRSGAPDIDGQLLAHQLRALQTRSHPFNLEIQPPLSPEDTVQLYRDPEFQRTAPRTCTLTSSYTFVDPTGNLYPCFSLEMGNVFEHPFEKVWNGPKYRAFRRLLRREGRLPICAHCTA